MLPFGLVVGIRAPRAGGVGSIPAQGQKFFSCLQSLTKHFEFFGQCTTFEFVQPIGVFDVSNQ